MSWLSRLRNALIPNRLDEDVAEEMADHLERRAAALAETGLTEEEARRAARARFGNTLLLREKAVTFAYGVGSTELCKMSAMPGEAYAKGGLLRPLLSFRSP